MATLLSTKKLRLSQKQLLLNAGIALVEYDAIQIELLDFDWSPSASDHLIFTSKNAAKAVFKKFPELAKTNRKGAFCVGRATCKLLQASGTKVLETASYGRDLAKIISGDYSSNSFTYFCGNKRREELPALLSESGVEIEEVVVYKTSIKTREFPQDYDGVMFFSPSGVQSYFAKNKMEEGVAFCIGDTTADEARKHTSRVIVANRPSIENVIVQAVKYFQN